MTKITKIIFTIIVGILAVIGALTVALFIYYLPAIDRLAIRPCHYYPNMFIDCRVVE